MSPRVVLAVHLLLANLQICLRHVGDGKLGDMKTL